MKDLADKIEELYQHVTPRGKDLLNEIISDIQFQLNAIQMTIQTEEHEND